ncbi:MAG TPA: PHB depolymerase family esterase [Candidatus Dormibacteraeota bacterium]|nr:PHB depolymerase family esterase [Candidatus Dormibacteraeota bacterium]
MPAARAAATAATMTFDGLDRSYLLWRPAGLARSSPVPLVIAMHGYTSSAAQMESMTRFDEVAIEFGFVVVYPQGLGRSWDAGWCCHGNTGDDVAFLDALIDQVVLEQNIDRSRVLATGMSNGAMMAQRLACELPGRITAAVSVSGSLLVGSCHPSRPISILEVHGEADAVVPIKGGFRSGLGTFRSTLSVMQEWAGIDGCPSDAAVADNPTVTSYTWAPCRAGTRVELEAVKRGGHSWFGPQDAAGEPDASRIAWHFLMDAPPLAS